jgi:hypothetical protein
MQKYRISVLVAAGVLALASASSALLVGCTSNSREVPAPRENPAAQTVASVGTIPAGVTCAKVAPSPAWLPTPVTATAILV